MIAHIKITLIFSAVFMIILTQSGSAQFFLNKEDVYASYFRETQDACRDSEVLWGMNLYGPILIVDQNTREVIANQADSVGELTRKNEVFIGKLSDKVSLANTSLKWNGTKWAMVLLPLPNEKDKRIRLLAHELFHRSQSDLKFVTLEADNSHLDQKQARIYLRLEMQALKNALISQNDTAENFHLTNALAFRTLRNTLYQNSDTNENLLELNEGLAEFTAFFFSMQSSSMQRKALSDAITEFMSKPSYVRSFAYYTTPAYGFFLYKRNKFWTQAITPQTDLTKMFISNMNLKLPDDPLNSVQHVDEIYELTRINKEENERERIIEGQRYLYKTKLLGSSHLVLKNEAMNISFDPSSLISLGDDGTVYPSLKIIDKWGILTVRNGALISPNWDVVRVSEPTGWTSATISGEGWTLELTQGYTLSKRSDGTYQLVKD